MEEWPGLWGWGPSLLNHALKQSESLIINLQINILTTFVKGILFWNFTILIQGLEKEFYVIMQEVMEKIMYSLNIYLFILEYKLHFHFTLSAHQPCFNQCPLQLCIDFAYGLVTLIGFSGGIRFSLHSCTFLLVHGDWLQMNDVQVDSRAFITDISLKPLLYLLQWFLKWVVSQQNCHLKEARVRSAWSHASVALARASAILFALELNPNVAFHFGGISFTPIHTCSNWTMGK